MVQIYNFFFKNKNDNQKKLYFLHTFLCFLFFSQLFLLSFIPKIKIYDNFIIFPNLFGDYRKKSYLCNVYQRIVQQYLSDRELKNKNIYIKRRKENIMKKYVCDVCGWVYDPEVGDPEGGIAPGTAFEDIPEDWVCPLCGVGKDDFSLVEE